MGILMYELLTGELPFKGDNAVEIALKHIKEPFPKIRSILPNLPQSIENIIMKATAKNTKNRYNDAREMHDDLKTALTDERSTEPTYNFKYKELDELSKRYQEEITKPLFHNCYRMAWENYINQRRLEAAERRANYYEDRIHFWHYHMPPPPRRYYRR